MYPFGVSKHRAARLKAKAIQTSSALFSFFHTPPASTYRAIPPISSERVCSSNTHLHYPVYSILPSKRLVTSTMFRSVTSPNLANQRNLGVEAPLSRKRLTTRLSSSPTSRSVSASSRTSTSSFSSVDSTESMTIQLSNDKLYTLDISDGTTVITIDEMYLTHPKGWSFRVTIRESKNSRKGMDLSVPIKKAHNGQAIWDLSAYFDSLYPHWRTSEAQRKLILRDHSFSKITYQQYAASKEGSSRVPRQVWNFAIAKREEETVNRASLMDKLFRRRSSGHARRASVEA